ISDMLFRAFAKADEGEMSRRLADLVRKEACADVARVIDLGAAIRLGASEANAGGRGRSAILADVCEALIGAVFVDGGYAAASALIERLWSERMRTPVRPLRDAKTLLQEWAHERNDRSSTSERARDSVATSSAPSGEAGIRCGFIALIGAPNVGKSTLINALVGTKLAIVSHKVQTTRMPLRGIAIAGRSQLV